jgi:hypothetical protein
MIGRTRAIKRITFTSGATELGSTREDRTRRGQGDETVLGQSVPADVTEAYLLGVSTEPTRREVTLTFRDPGGRREFRLVAAQVEYMVIDEFLHQNIVHEVRLFGSGTERRVVQDLLASLYYNKDSADVVEDGLQSRLEESTRFVLDGRRALLEIEPVYGARVLLLAESIEWVL